MKKTLLIATTIMFTALPTLADSNHGNNPIEIADEKSNAAEDWKKIKEALLKKDVPGVGSFASTDKLDADALIKDASAHSYIHSVLKTYDFEHLKKETYDGFDFLVFHAYTTTTDEKDVKTKHTFDLYMSVVQGKLMIHYYVAV